MIAIFWSDFKSKGTLILYNLKTKKLFLTLDYFSEKFQAQSHYYDRYIEIEAVQIRRDGHILMFFRRCSHLEIMNRFCSEFMLGRPDKTHFSQHQFWDFRRSRISGEDLGTEKFLEANVNYNSFWFNF